MRNFLHLGTVDVLPLMLAVQARPDLWNRHFVDAFAQSPARESDHIVLRFQPDGGSEDIRTEFFPAWAELPQVRPIVFDLMRRVEAVGLGRVVISRLEPGGRVYQHRDVGTAYADQKNGMRFHVALKGEPGSWYICGEESVCMQTGTVWWFNHGDFHRVENTSEADRIHLIVDMEKAP